MAPNNLTASFRLAILATLLLQNAVYTLCRRYSVGIRLDGFKSVDVLLLGELFKFFLSLYKINLDGEWRTTASTLPAYVYYVMKESKRMAALAWIYAAMNLLSFLSLARIDAGTFTIVAQLKILSTGFFSWVVLGRTFSKVKVLALSFLVLGAILVTSPTLGTSGVDTSTGKVGVGSSGGDQFLGVAFVAVEVLLSGFASIYFEKVIKGGGEAKVMGIFERNVQLALHSMPFYIFLSLKDGGGLGANWNMWGTVLALLGGGGGILVALSVKYSDAVLKSLATSGAIVLATWAGHVLLDGPLNFSMILGMLIVMLSIFQYSTDGVNVFASVDVGAKHSKNNSETSLQELEKLVGNTDEEEGKV